MAGAPRWRRPSRQLRRLLPPDADLSVPVPLHRWRLVSRGFNQAALIAIALRCEGGPPVARDALRRVKRTPLLRGLGARARTRAVQGAFAADPRQQARIEGRHIVLVDDVYTSGATTDACVAVLRRAGAARVTILCWARVLPDGD